MAQGLTLQSCRAPIAGGQYFWVSMLAPVRYKRFASYITGERMRKHMLQVIRHGPCEDSDPAL